MANSSPPRSMRHWIQQQSEEYGVDVDDLLIQSKRRDPMYKGTEADHEKAQWFANLWKQAVADREDERIHIRGIHYFIVMAGDGAFDIDADAVDLPFDPDDLPDLGVVEPPTNCSWDEYQNTAKCYDYLEEAAMLARILGYVPLDGIIDRKHSQRLVTDYGDHTRVADADDVPVPTGVDTPTIPEPDDRAELEWEQDDDGGDSEEFEPENYVEFVASELAGSLVDHLEFDTARQAPFHLELWSEKTLPPYIKDLAREKGVNVVVEGQGDLSLTIAGQLAGRIHRAGKPAVILYLSDYDPKGTAMPTNVAGKLAWLKQRGDLDQRVCIERLAVTKEQVEQYGLPRKPIEESQHTGTGGRAYNTLVDEWEERRGVGATELNTLQMAPDLYRHIVASGIDRYIDAEIETRNEHATEEWEADVRDLLVDAFEDAGLDDREADLRQWVAEFNSALEKSQRVFAGLRELLDDGIYADIQDQTQDAVEAAEFPVAAVPEGEAGFPADPLYDTEREYWRNLDRIREYRSE